MRTSQIRHLSVIILLCGLIVVSCATTPAPIVPTPTLPLAPTIQPTALLPTPSVSPTARPEPTHYTAQTLLHNIGRPDDLVFDTQGHLLFSDPYNGTISQVNSDGTATILLHGLPAPEGLVVLSDGTLIIAEQGTHSIASLAPGSTSPTTIRMLPGVASNQRCKDGVDGIGYDPLTNTIIVPDSPTGEVYRMTTDGKTLTLLASGIVRPVGATADAQGNIYIADECGGAIWRIATNGQKTRISGFGAPDDVVFDTRGNLLITDLDPAIHALIRLNIATGQRETLASQGFIEPQGLVLDRHDNIFISDDYANIIKEFSPAN